MTAPEAQTASGGGLLCPPRRASSRDPEWRAGFIRWVQEGTHPLLVAPAATCAEGDAFKAGFLAALLTVRHQVVNVIDGMQIGFDTKADTLTFLSEHIDLARALPAPTPKESNHG